jgi:hypothetical protein
MRSLIIAALLAAGSAHADLVSKGDNAKLVLFENKPCDLPELMVGVPPEMIDQVHSGYVESDGRVIRLCWTRNGDIGLIRDENGDGGMVNLAAFKPDGA